MDLVQGNMGVNGISSFILQESTAYSCHLKPGTVPHQEEPRTHCSGVRSDSGSMNFILIRNGSRVAVPQSVEVGVSRHEYNSHH